MYFDQFVMTDPWTIVLTVIGGAVCVYLYGTRNHGYFERMGVPFVKPTPIFGNMGGMVFKTKTMPDMLAEIYNCDDEARYVGFYDFSTPIILLKDPELVKSIAIKHFDSFPNHRITFKSPAEPLFEKNLFSLNDEPWRNMRTVLSPSFTSSKMKMMFGVMSKCAEDFAGYLSEQDPQPEELDMRDTFGRYTLDVIASSAYGLTVNSMRDRDNDFYRMGQEVTRLLNSPNFTFFLIWSFPSIAKLFNMKLMDPKATDFFMNVIRDTIATRDAQGIVRPDMIQLMMQARERKDVPPMSAEDMAAQAFVFFLGGFDTSATTMSFVANLVATNPDVQRKLQAEIDRVIEKSSGDVSYEDLHAMKYLDAVISESLRIYPPAAFLDRIGPKDFTLPPSLPGLEPLRIKAGQNIWIPVWCFHHDPKYFPNPDKFDPERFSDENKSDMNPLTYLPFGLGPRSCIANRFALMELKLVFFHLLSKCNLLPTPKTREVIKLSKTTLAMMAEGGFWLKIEPR